MTLFIYIGIAHVMIDGAYIDASPDPHQILENDSDLTRVRVSSSNCSTPQFRSHPEMEI
jgi:hypothetical protein